MGRLTGWDSRICGHCQQDVLPEEKPSQFGENHIRVHLFCPNCHLLMDSKDFDGNLDGTPGSPAGGEE